jgi:3-oxoacyl-(acyl-carrier-protein) synthase
MEQCGFPVSPLPQPIEGRYLLSTNSGFGGINAALILKGDPE